MSFELEFVTSCEKCGAPLDSSFSVERYGEKIIVEVEPCPACIRQAEEDAKEKGYEEGYSTAEHDMEESR